MTNFDTEATVTVHAIRMADVRPRRVEWLWPGRVPLGKITALDGDPGLGKSTALLDLAARVSTGSPMPTGERMSGPAGVVLLSAEDGAADTIRPRLDAAGADLERVFLFDSVTDPDGIRPPSLPLDQWRLEDLITQHEAALVIVDPLMAYLGGKVDSAKDSDVRRALHPLKQVAERTGAALVVLRHLNKSGGTNPLYRGGGSIGIIGAARAGLLVARDPDDETRRIVACTKSNLAVEPPAVAYRLVSDDLHGVARVQWEGTTAHKAADLLTGQDDDEGHGARDEAAEFLRDLLSDGPVPAKEAMARARASGISTRTLKRAKAEVGVKSERHGGAADHGAWSWSLESSLRGPTEAKDASETGVAPLAPLADRPALGAFRVIDGGDDAA